MMGHMADGTAERQDWSRLARLVVERRNELGMTQADVQAAGGPSQATMYLIEHAGRTRYQARILNSLERVLRWRPGSVRAVLEGGDPTPIEEAAAPVVTRVRVEEKPPAEETPYTDPYERQIWEMDLPEDERRSLIAHLRALKEQEDARSREYYRRMRDRDDPEPRSIAR